MFGRFAKTWKIGDASKIKIDLPCDFRAARPGTNGIDIDGSAAGPKS